jgi:hypothetical protein
MIARLRRQTPAAELADIAGAQVDGGISAAVSIASAQDGGGGIERDLAVQRNRRIGAQHRRAVAPAQPAAALVAGRLQGQRRAISGLGDSGAGGEQRRAARQHAAARMLSSTPGVVTVQFGEQRRPVPFGGGEKMRAIVSARLANCRSIADDACAHGPASLPEIRRSFDTVRAGAVLSPSWRSTMTVAAIGSGGCQCGWACGADGAGFDRGACAVLRVDRRTGSIQADDMGRGDGREGD